MSKPRVLVLADTPTWAWARKAAQYARHLADDFDIAVAYHANFTEILNERTPDLIHLFEVSQTGHVPAGFSGRVVAGLTANVWRTWGTARMQGWASKVDGLHGNSVLICGDLHRFHERVYYTPNGVDPDFWHPEMRQHNGSHAGPLVVAHVGKPNPRKGGDLIIDACRIAGVKLLACRRTSHIALAPEQVREQFYWQSHVVVAASDMDGTPNPCLEGAACGLPVISTWIGNMPEFIRPDQNGYLYGPGPDNGTLPWVAVCPECREIEGRPSLCDHGPDLDLIERVTHDLAHKFSLLKHNRDLTAAMGAVARTTVLNDWTWAQQVRYVRTMWWDVLERRDA